MLSWVDYVKVCICSPSCVATCAVCRALLTGVFTSEMLEDQQAILCEPYKGASSQGAGKASKA